jgi:hypothetical protein
MDTRQLREYRERWKAVKEVELEEQRQASIMERWQQLNYLYAMAQVLGLIPPGKDDEIELVRTRWVSLKDRT